MPTNHHDDCDRNHNADDDCPQYHDGSEHDINNVVIKFYDGHDGYTHYVSPNDFDVAAVRVEYDGRSYHLELDPGEHDDDCPCVLHDDAPPGDDVVVDHHHAYGPDDDTTGRDVTHYDDAGHILYVGNPYQRPACKHDDTTGDDKRSYDDLVAAYIAHKHDPYVVLHDTTDDLDLWRLRADYIDAHAHHWITPHYAAKAVDLAANALDTARNRPVG